MRSLEPSRDPEIAPGHTGITTLFLFDYESPEGDSVFGSIRACLERSRGVCAFNDTGLLSAKTLMTFADQAVSTRTVEGGVVGTRQYRSIKPSVAAMWTDRPENVTLFHDYLNLHTVPRYQGAVLLDDRVSYADFLGFCACWSPARAEVGSGPFGKVVAAGLDACHDVLGRLQPLYARFAHGRARSPFEVMGAVTGVSLIVAILAYLLAGSSAVTPVVDEGAPANTALVESIPKATEPFEGHARDAVPGTGDGVRRGVKSHRPAGDRPVNPVAGHTKPDIEPGAAYPAPFTVQVGSFHNAASAAALVQKLEARGYRPVIAVARLATGRTTHRVRVGAFETRKEASAFGATLQEREPIVTGFFVAANP